MKRRIYIYGMFVFLAVLLGLPSRLAPNVFPEWYVLYAGDFLWSFMLYYIIVLVFNLKTTLACYISLCLAYFIEVTQLFHPLWLDYLRSIKAFSFVLGYSFLWTDIIAYTFGIVIAALLDKFIRAKYEKGCHE